MDWLWELPKVVWNSFTRVALYPIDPTQRIYGLYLLTSLICAIGVFLIARRTERSEEEGEKTSVLARLTRFVFPREVWTHRSSWVDVRYFLPHQMVRI